MSYPGIPEPGSYWNGHGSPSEYTYNGQRAPSQPMQNGSHPRPTQAQLQPQYNNPQFGQYQNPPVPYDRSNASTPSTINGVQTTSSAQAQAPHPQFINPAQLFQQPQPPYQPSPQTQFIRPATITSSNTSARMAPTNHLPAPLDLSKLLMSLAEEYFDAAHQLAPSTSIAMTIENVEAYEKLISTGLGCLDTALKHAKSPPRVEANIRLRYSGVLYEETENFMEAETSLSKGIALCERNHYYDLKYAMQFLLARLMFKKNPKASMKALDGYIADAQAYQHFSWVYAMRFLRASQSLESGTPSDIHAALTNFKSITNLSAEQSDRAIYMAASLMEGMAHLRSTSLESMEQAQQAIAQVWTYQLDGAARVPQLLGLAHILDVVCSLRQGNPQVMVKKLNAMQKMMDEALRDGTWSATSDIVAIPINRRQNSSQVVSSDTRMILGIGDDGRDNLLLSFLNQNDAYAITYLLSGMVLLHKTSKEASKDQDQKAIKFLEAGLTSLRKDIHTCRASPGLLPDFLAKLQWRGQISCYVSGYMAFCAAASGSWAEVRSCIERIRSTAKELELQLSGPLHFLAMYLSGVYYQGIGDLDAALQIFQDEIFNLPPESNPQLAVRSVDQVERDISLLAALNTLWILQDSRRKDLLANTAIIARLEPFCKSHANRDVETAFNLIVATVETNPTTPLFKVKNYLRAALEGAQATANTQFLCITLNVMCSKFFANVVGEQAEKSALAASVQARRSGNPLWKSVADQMLARCYEVNGKKSDAQAAMNLAQRYTHDLRVAQEVPDL